VSPVEQRLSALNVANRRRCEASRLKREIARGTLSLTDALGDPRAEVVVVAVLLGCRRGWGQVKVRKALRAAGVSPTLRVRELTNRQRKVLERLLGGQ
jgi:hypothetical protein